MLSFLKNLNIRWTIAKTLIAGLIFLTVVAAILGGSGLFYITQIDKKLNHISDKTAPTVETADDLRANIWESTKVAEEIIADEDIADIEELIVEFGQLSEEYNEAYIELDELVDDEDLLDELTNAKQFHVAFLENSQAMFEAHLNELNEEINADDFLDKFDSTGAELIVMLDEFATENEDEMQKVEDEGDRLVASGIASASQINRLLGDLFEQDYPVVEASLKLQKLVMEMQDTAGEYMAVEDPAELEAVSAEFMRLSGTAQPFFDILHKLAESQEDKEDAVRLEETFDSWVSRANQEEQLFDTHRDMLQYEKLADDLTEKLEGNADEVAEALDVVASQADALSDSADEEAAEVVKTATFVVGVGILIATLASGLLILLVIRTVTGPIGNMTEAMGFLADDKLDTEIPGLQRKDEIGNMAKAVEVFKNNAIEVKRLNAEQEKQKAMAEAEQKKAMLDMADDFEGQLGSIIASLSSSSDDMQGTAKDMKGVAEEMVSSSTSVASASEESSTNAATVASAMEEMVASSKEIAGQMSRAQQKSTQTRDSAADAAQTVDNLNTRVENIGEVVTAIQDIAEQTNLLALNATIEAARAGESGKGFAVVADEVKKLANETAEKTNEINDRIQEVQAATTDTVKAMTVIIDNIADIDQAVVTVSSAIEEQNSTSQEINRSVSESAQAAQEVTEIITNVKNQAQNTGETSDVVLGSALELANLSKSIKDSVGSFLNNVRKDNQVNQELIANLEKARAKIAAE